MQPLVTILLVLLIVAVVLSLVNNYLPMDPLIKKVINIIVVLAAIVWLLQSVGLIAHR